MGVLRGGSWINQSRNARCAARNRNDPDNNFNDNIGFRLVVSIAFFPREASAFVRGPVDPVIERCGTVPRRKPARPIPGRVRATVAGQIQKPPRVPSY